MREYSYKKKKNLDRMFRRVQYKQGSSSHGVFSSTRFEVISLLLPTVVLLLATSEYCISSVRGFRDEEYSHRAQMSILKAVETKYLVNPTSNGRYYYREPVHSAPWFHRLYAERRLHRSLQSSSQQTEALPIRIYTHVQLHSSTSEFVKSEVENVILPQVKARLHGAIRVISPVTGNLKIQRFCNNYYTWNDGTEECASVSPLGKCGDASEVADFFDDYTLCTGMSIGDCQTFKSTNVQEPGVSDSDFILYVSTDPTYCTGDTLATGGFCDLDQISYRPLTGYLNFCPDKITSDNVTSIATGVHEAYHGLFFNEALYKYYIDNTSKESSGKYTRLGESNVIKSISSRGKTVKVVATPETVKHTRLLTGCDSMLGAEIENEGGDGTGNTHWDSRIFLNEIMTGMTGDSAEQHGNYQALSNITLALAKDTGWYDVDYSESGQALPFVQNRYVDTGN